MAHLYVTKGITEPQKKDLVARVSDVLCEVEELPGFRSAVTVLISEIDAWGGGGAIHDRESVSKAFGKRAQERK